MAADAVEATKEAASDVADQAEAAAAEAKDMAVDAVDTTKEAASQLADQAEEAADQASRNT